MEDGITPKQWAEMQTAVRLPLRRLCGQWGDGPPPSPTELQEAVRLIWPRLGLFKMGLDDPGRQIADLHDATLWLCHTQACGIITQDSLQHRLIAAGHCLGWLEAYWAIDPLSKTWRPLMMSFPWVGASEKPYPVPRPVGFYPLRG